MKRYTISYGMVLLFAFGLWLAGCSDNSNNFTGPSGNALSNDERDDLVDDYGAALAAPDEGMLPLWMQMGTGSGGDLRAPGQPGALDDTTRTDWFGFNVVLVRNYYDTAGNWYEFYDPETSVRMSRLLWIDGSHTNVSGRRTVTVDHFDSLMVIGLDPASGAYTLSGSGERTVDSEFSSRFRQNVKTLTATYAWTVNDVLISKDRELHPYPLDGSLAVTATFIRTHQNPGRNFEETVHVTWVISFDGSQWAELIFADGQHYWIDLSTGYPYRMHP